MPDSNEAGQETISSSEKTGAERRRNLRFPFSASIEVTETKSGARIAGRTSDLGLGGCYVDAISPFPVGAEAHVRIRKGEEFFEAQVRVVYSQIGMGMGLAFISAQPKHYRLFQQWLLEISGKTPLPPDPPKSDAPKQNQQAAAIGSAKDATGSVLNELIIALVRKRVLSEEEGKGLLKKLRQ